MIMHPLLQHVLQLQIIWKSRPLGSKLLQIYDRQFALISATVMTYNIVGRQREPDYLQYLS